METGGNSSWWLSISINFGVLEYWSNDERIDAFFFKTPILQGRDFQELLQALNHLFIGYNYVFFITDLDVHQMKIAVDQDRTRTCP
jgi:hypothetical protein